MSWWYVMRTSPYFTRATIGTLAATVFGAHFLPHGPFLKTYQGIMQMYSGEEPRALSPELLATAQSALNDCNLKDEQKKKISFFINVSTDVFHAGGYNFPWGAIIGLPCTYEKDEKINFVDLKIIGRDEVDWSIEGLDLLETLKISDAAKKFSIAREVFSSNIEAVFENGLLAAVCMILSAQLCRLYNLKWGTLKYPLKKRMFPYICFYAWGFLLYIAFRDPFKHMRDVQCDKQVALISPEYLEGGIEYYRTSLERNKAMRTIMKKQGESRFTEEGDVRRSLFALKLPLTARLERLRKLKEEQAAIESLSIEK